MGATEKLHIFADITQHIIYIIGGSFVAGSAVTLLVLIALDYIGRLKAKEKQKK